MSKLNVKISMFLKQFKAINTPFSVCPICSVYRSTIPATYDYKDAYQNAEVTEEIIYNYPYHHDNLYFNVSTRHTLFM